MNKYKLLLRRSLFAASLLSIVGCGNDLPALNGIDAKAWQNDKNGCNGVRAANIAALQEQKHHFLGLSEMEIVDVFGKPDKNELAKRNQKFYHYFLQPSTDCQTPAELPLRLSIRFNAMGLAKEIAVE